MSKRYISSSEESEEERKEKKQKKGKKEAEPVEVAETKWELGKKRKISINEFKGRKLIDIREFYEADDGTEKPGRKGISLSVDQWNKLKELIPKVDKAIS